MLALLVMLVPAAVPLTDSVLRPITLFALPKNQTQSFGGPSIVACIVEPRPGQMPLVDYVIDNVASFLGPSVKIQFYHGASTHPCNARPVGRTCHLFKEGQVELHNLHVDNFDVAGYSRLLSRVDFWEDKAGYKKTLIFQTDSVICKATDERIENFMGLDFVGSHGDDAFLGIHNGGNGGFSLRDTQLSLECSSELGNGLAEDAYFIKCMQARGARMATTEEQDRFGSQNYFAAKSLGAHQINKQLFRRSPTLVGSFQEYCPEYLGIMSLRERLPRLPALSSTEHLSAATPAY